eukprot:1160327-Pelagomonas_calceolata.AAC.1
MLTHQQEWTWWPKVRIEDVYENQITQNPGMFARLLRDGQRTFHWTLLKLYVRTCLSSSFLSHEVGIGNADTAASKNAREGSLTAKKELEVVNSNTRAG